MGLGFVFPGQGSQTVGMLEAMAAQHAIVRATFEEAGDVLGLAMWQLVQEGPQERLNQTEVTQPVLLTASVALWRAWREQGGPAPELLAGHSLGEYSALVCAGAIPSDVGVSLVHRRGALMQEAVPQGEGAMAAVLGLDDDVVIACCERVSPAAGVVSPANFNAPGQVAIAGSAAAVSEAIELCNEAGAKRAVPLQVSGPFHCALMEPAKARFAEALAEVELSMPAIPVVHNVDAAIATDTDDLRSKLLEQMARPVQWTRCVQTMVERNVHMFVECGAGKVLAGLIKRIDRTCTVHNIEAVEAFEAALG